MDRLDRNIINELQRSFPISDRPYAEMAGRLDTSEEELLLRLRNMLDDGLLTRFGPMYHAEMMGGALSLCAMQVPELQFDAVAEKLNAFPEVAHNYQRDHKFNMWFVLATETREKLEQVINDIEVTTGHHVLSVPKIEEFYVGLHFRV